MNDYLILAAVAANMGISLLVLYLSNETKDKLKLKNGTTPEIKTIADGVESLLTEFLPQGGASISYRVNSLIQSANGAIDNAIAAKTVGENVRDMVSRVDNNLGRIQESLSALSLVLAGQNKTQAEIVHKMNIILNSGEAGQVLAGKGTQDKT